MDYDTSKIIFPQEISLKNKMEIIKLESFVRYVTIVVN